MIFSWCTCDKDINGKDISDFVTYVNEVSCIPQPVLLDVFQALMIRVCDRNSKMRAYFCDEPNEGGFSEIFVRYLSWRSLCILFS
jgi:hypothetical protein